MAIRRLCEALPGCLARGTFEAAYAPQVVITSDVDVYTLTTGKLEVVINFEQLPTERL